MKIGIKNMVCPRCVNVVRAIFEKSDISILSIKLGEVQIQPSLKKEQIADLKLALAAAGFELLDGKRTQLINEIKSILIQEIHYANEPASINYSSLLTEKLPYDYAYLSRLFSAVEGRTIEKYILNQKIEKVKELLTYGELSLSKIAFQMNYSSAAYLSTQFKKVTGMSPTAFKKLQNQERQFLDQV